VRPFFYLDFAQVDATRMDPEEPVCVNVAEGIFVGNLAAAESTSELSKHKIRAIINVSGDDLATPGVIIHSFILTNQELLPMERQKIISRLISIKNIITELSPRGNILICCYDGRSQSMLVAGYYMITALAQRSSSVIAQLETLYFTPELREDEQRDLLRIANVDPTLPPETFTNEEFAALQQSRETRRGLRGFAISSFKALLSSI